MTAKNTRTVKVQTTARRSKAKSAAPNEDELHIHFPKDEDWKDLIKTLGLPKPKAKILMETLGDIVMDIAVIKKIKAKKIKKPDAIRRIENLELRLEQAIKTLRNESKDLTDIVPMSALEELGNLFTFGAASTVAGKNCFPRMNERDIEKITDAEPLMTMQSIEKFYAGCRRDNGVMYGGHLLAYALAQIQIPLQNWLRLNSENVGGRPKQSFRELAIQRLIHFAPAILGSKPTPSVTGRFMKMTTLSLYLCGFPEDGLEKAIATDLRKWKAFNEAGEEHEKRKPKSTKTLVPKP